MSDFFHGWRRKIGVLTLGLACMFAGGWIRSLGIADHFQSMDCQLISFRGGIFIEAIPGLPERPQSTAPEFHYSNDAAHQRDPYSHPSLAELWRWRRFGFAYGETEAAVATGNGTNSTVNVLRFYFPYWSVTIPLTLLSAWLLLSKPRVAKPTATTDS